LLFSGGFDSVAFLHKMIFSGHFSKIVVLFEKSDNLNGEYERVNAKNIYDSFKEKYEREKNVLLEWIEEIINVDYLSYETSGREMCLLIHLMTILKHGEINNYYLGWHKKNINEFDITEKMFLWFEKNKITKEYEVNFLDDWFGIEEESTKTNVIKYLLENNLFGLPYSSEIHETVEEHNEREYWFIQNSKEREVARAIINIDSFDSKDISNIFSFKTTQDIQNYYNLKLESDKLENN